MIMEEHTNNKKQREDLFTALDRAQAKQEVLIDAVFKAKEDLIGAESAKNSNDRELIQIQHELLKLK